MNRYKNTLTVCLIIVIGLFITQCEDPIKSELFGEYSLVESPSPETMRSILNGLYAEFQINGTSGRDNIYLNDFVGGHLWNERGGLSRQSAYAVFWTWDSQNPTWIRTACWTRPYSVIRNANSLLEAIDGSQLTDENKILYRAEARFMRATMYAFMYNWFGTVPLRTSTSDESQLGRADEDELLIFIESEIAASAGDLPSVTEEYGRVTKGAAYAILMKHCLNLKEWSKVIEYANLIDGLGLYSLYTAGENPYRDLFDVAFEEIENETILAFPANSLDGGTANVVMAHSYPESDYQSFLDGSAPRLTNQTIAGTKNRVYDHFYNSFDPNDIRRKLILTEYINSSGDTIVQEPNKKSPFKYWPDPNADGGRGGHDFKVVRYADVLLSKAEAMNELNGPTQECLDLINQVRSRAKIGDLSLSDASSKEVLRDLILRERGWEFWFEAKRREDLIRHGKFIEMKRNHPVHPVPTAEDFRVLFPIPQAEIDANPNIVQNQGY